MKSLMRTEELSVHRPSLQTNANRERVDARRQSLIAQENAFRFDPGRNPADLAVLRDLIQRPGK